MDGTQPGFKTLDNLGTAILIAGWTGFGLSAIVVGLRLYVRLGITKSRLADHDWVMLSALVSGLPAARSIDLDRRLTDDRYATSSPCVSKSPPSTGASGGTKTP